MGKKSKKKSATGNTSGSSAASLPAVAAPASSMAAPDPSAASANNSNANTTGVRELRVDWEMIAPPAKHQTLEMLASPEALRSKLARLPSSGTWRVSIRRARLWFERDKVAAKRIEPKYRSWFFSVMIGLPDTCKVYTVMMDDEKAIAKDTRNLAFTRNHFLAALQLIMDHVKSKPSNVVLWPNVSFRIPSVQKLLNELQSRRIPNEVLPPTSMLPCHEPISPLSDCNHAVEIHPLDETNDAECFLFEMLCVGKDGLVPAVETNLERPDSIQGLGKSHRSAYIPSLTENATVSRLDLWRFFAVGKVFHEKRPWETVSERHPLQVTVPDPYRLRREDASDDIPTRTYFCMVSGFGAWDARGIHMYKSWNDATKYVNDSGIMYFRRTWTPYRTLDHIEELGLDLAKNDGENGEESYPWLVYNKAIPVTPEDSFDHGKLSPDSKDIPSLILAWAAVTKYVEQYCRLHQDNTLSLPAHSVDVDFNDILPGKDDELSKLQCGTTAKVTPCAGFEAQKFAGGDFSSDEYMATMSVGAERECNYCQKPERILRKELGERLQSCGRCKSIHYCSRKCQVADWARHKKDCIRK